MVTTRLNPAQLNVLSLLSYISTEQEQQELQDILLQFLSQEDGQPASEVPAAEQHHPADIGRMAERARKDTILMKIVLDTNCLVNVIMPESYNNDIWQAFRASKYMLCVTNEIV